MLSIVPVMVNPFSMLIFALILLVYALMILILAFVVGWKDAVLLELINRGISNSEKEEDFWKTNTLNKVVALMLEKKNDFLPYLLIHIFYFLIIIIEIISVFVLMILGYFILPLFGSIFSSNVFYEMYKIVPAFLFVGVLFIVFSFRALNDYLFYTSLAHRKIVNKGVVNSLLWSFRFVILEKKNYPLVLVGIPLLIFLNFISIIISFIPISGIVIISYIVIDIISYILLMLISGTIMKLLKNKDLACN